MAKKTSAFNFEKGIERLNQLVANIEKGELSLEESLTQFEEGTLLAQQCQQALKEAEQKVQVLIEKNNEYSLKPFNNHSEE